MDNIIEFVIMLYKYRSMLITAMSKINVLEAQKIGRTLEFNDNKLKKLLEKERLVINYNFQGKDYDPGMACDVINIDEFNPGDELVITQVLEPVILKDGCVIHRAKIMVEKKEEIK